MKSARFGFLLLSAVVLPFAVQAGELPFLTPEEAVSMAITPRNNVKNTLHKAVPAEVAGLNRAFSSRTTWSKRNQVLKENNLLASATTMNPSEHIRWSPTRRKPSAAKSSIFWT